MKLRADLKDWEIAREMFGSNAKEICKIVKKLRDKGEVVPHCEGWSLISEKGKDDFGWLISNELLE
jgi:hypothetical protein